MSTHQITFLSTLLNWSNIQCSVKKQNRIASRKCGFCSTINRIMSSLSMQWITLQLGCSFTLYVNHRECTRVHDFVLYLFFRDYSCALFCTCYTQLTKHDPSPPPRSVRSCGLCPPSNHACFIFAFSRYVLFHYTLPLKTAGFKKPWTDTADGMFPKSTGFMVIQKSWNVTGQTSCQSYFKGQIRWS